MKLRIEINLPGVSSEQFKSRSAPWGIGTLRKVLDAIEDSEACVPDHVKIDESQTTHPIGPTTSDRVMWPDSIQLIERDVPLVSTALWNRVANPEKTNVDKRVVYIESADQERTR